MQDQPTGTRPRPRIFYGWYIVMSSMVSNAIVSAVYFQGFSAFVLPIESTFGWSRSVISGAASLRQAEAGIFGPVTGFLLDRYGPRKVIFIGALVVGFGLIGLGMSTGVLTFYALFLFISMGTSGVGHGVTWVVVVARWFRRRRGLAIGLAVVGPVFGAPMVVANAWFIDAYGWRAVFIAYGIVVTVVVSAVALVARSRPEDYGMLPDGDDPSAVAEDGSEATGPEPSYGFRLSQAAKSKAFWLLSTYLGALFIANSGFQLHQIPYFVEDRGFSTAAAATTIPLVVWASGFGRVGGGWLLDQMDYRVMLAVIAGLMAAGIIYLQVVQPSSLWGAAPFALLFGLSFGGTIPLRGVLGSMMFGTRNLGAVVGLLQGTGVAAGVVGPILMGGLRDWLGDYTLGLWILMGIALAALVPVMLMESGKTLAARAQAAR